MSDKNKKLKSNQKPVIDWPEQLKSVNEINLFEDVIATLKAADNTNKTPSS
jgi:hypothetical protein